MTDEQRLATITEYFKNKYPETIFNHDIKLNELKRFGGLDMYELIMNSNQDFYHNSDNAYYQLLILMSMRGLDDKSQEYSKKIKNQDILGLLFNDF